MGHKRPNNRDFEGFEGWAEGGPRYPSGFLGGKGEEMRAVQFEAASIVREIGVESVGEIRRVSRTTRAIDEAALQDSYSIYFHATIVSEKGTLGCCKPGNEPRRQDGQTIPLVV
jgi:hypothetical protein